MAGLDGDDASSSGQDGRVLDERRGAEVGGDTSGLEDAGDVDHGLGGGEAEVVLAGLDGLAAGGRDGSRELVHVGRLGHADLLETGDLIRRETERLEIAVGELLEGLHVECGLEMLKRQSARE